MKKFSIADYIVVLSIILVMMGAVLDTIWMFGIGVVGFWGSLTYLELKREIEDEG